MVLARNVFSMVTPVRIGQEVFPFFDVDEDCRFVA